MGADKVLEEWQMFLNNHDLGGITGLYSDEAVLWGTFSDIIRDTPGLIEEYFRRLLERSTEVKSAQWIRGIQWHHCIPKLRVLTRRSPSSCLQFPLSSPTRSRPADFEHHFSLMEIPVASPAVHPGHL